VYFITGEKDIYNEKIKIFSIIKNTGVYLCQTKYKCLITTTIGIYCKEY